MCKYIDAEYLVANAFLQGLKKGKRELSLSEIYKYSKKVNKELNNCVLSSSFNSIYAVTVVYPKIFKMANDVISLVDQNEESCKENLLSYFNEGLPKDVTNAFNVALI